MQLFYSIISTFSPARFCSLRCAPFCIASAISSKLIAFFRFSCRERRKEHNLNFQRIMHYMRERSVTLLRLRSHLLVVIVGVVIAAAAAEATSIVRSWGFVDFKVFFLFFFFPLGLRLSSRFGSSDWKSSSVETVDGFECMRGMQKRVRAPLRTEFASIERDPGLVMKRRECRARVAAAEEGGEHCAVSSIRVRLSTN